jgi:hypothetical protein
MSPTEDDLRELALILRRVDARWQALTDDERAEIEARVRDDHDGTAA